MTPRAANVSGLLTALVLLLAACAQKTPDSATVVAQRFYDYYFAQHMNNGLPTIEQCRQMGPMLSTALQDAFGRARREQDKFIGAHPDEKPPWADGDLFSSLFEGATSYDITRVDQAPDHADVLVKLTFSNAGGRTLTWSDRLVLVRENAHWVIEDLEYGGNWDFANSGSLRRSLLLAGETAPPARKAAKG